MSRRRNEYGKNVAATIGWPNASYGAMPLTAIYQWGVSVIHTSMDWAVRRVFPTAAMTALLLAPSSRLCAQSTAQTSAPDSGTAAQTAGPAASTALPKVGEILDRYEKAIGGRAAWEKFTSQVMMGTIDVPSAGFTGMVMVHEKTPNKFMTAVVINGAAFQQGYDGVQGWTNDPKNGLRDQSGPELAESKRGADFLHAFKLRRVYASMVVTGVEKIGGRDAWIIEAGVPEGGDPTKMYFDTQSGLLLRRISQSHDANGVSQLREDFDDYRDVDGVKVPFISRQTDGDTTYTMTFSEVHHNVDLSDSEFAKPAAQ
jgi:zinc protease